MKWNKSMKYGILTNPDMKQKKYIILYGVIFVSLVIVMLINIFPVLWVLLSGFKDVQELYAMPVKFLPEHIELSKILKVWNEMEFSSVYLATFIMAAGSIAFEIVVSGFAGYVLSRLRPPGTKFTLKLLFWLILLPGTMRTVPLYLMFRDFPILHVNMTDSFWPIWLMAAAAPFNVILFKNSFDGISKSLIEAAKIDGAGDCRIFFSIIVPLSIPVITTVAIFAFNGSFGQFFWPNLLISKKELTVLGVKLFKMKSGNYTIDYQMLAVFFSLVPQLIVFVIFQKKIVGGINVGGVKG